MRMALYAHQFDTMGRIYLMGLRRSPRESLLTLITATTQGRRNSCIGLFFLRQAEYMHHTSYNSAHMKGENSCI